LFLYSIFGGFKMSDIKNSVKLKSYINVLSNKQVNNDDINDTIKSIKKIDKFMSFHKEEIETVKSVFQRVYDNLT